MLLNPINKSLLNSTKSSMNTSFTSLNNTNNNGNIPLNNNSILSNKSFTRTGSASGIRPSLNNTPGKSS